MSPLLSSTGEPVSSSSVVRRFARQSLADRLFDDYARFSKIPGSNPPPYVPLCDFDINKHGLEKMQDWLQSQRLAAAASATTAPVSPAVSATETFARLYTDEQCAGLISRAEQRATAALATDPPPSTTSVKDAHTIPDAACIDLVVSDDDDLSLVSAVPSFPSRSKSKSKRRFRGNNWSKKGTKLSRRAARAGTSAPSVSSPPSPRTTIPLMPPPLPVSKCSATPPSKSARPPSSSTDTASVPSGPARDTPSSTESTRARSLRPATYAARPVIGSSPSMAPKVVDRSTAAFRTDHTTVVDVTDHSGASRPHAEKYADVSTPATTMRLRATYAYARGLHTTLHYPQEFHVALHGRPEVDSSGWYSRPYVFGDVGPGTAISAVVDHVTTDPKSLCNHPGCVYGFGDAFVRRQRHLLSIRQLDSQLGRPFASNNTISYDPSQPSAPYERRPRLRPRTAANPAPAPSASSEQCLVTASSQSSKTVVDSGASRHIEPDPSRLSDVAPTVCSDHPSRHQR